MKGRRDRSLRVDSLVQGLGLLVIATGLSWALFLLLRTESSSSGTEVVRFSPPGSLSHRTQCHLQGARIVGDVLNLQVQFPLKGSHKAEHRRGLIVTTPSGGCKTVDACLAQLQLSDPFECYYDAEQRSVAFIDESTPMASVVENNRTVTVVVHEEERMDGRGWLLFVLLSTCLCTPLCCLLGVVSVIEGLGVPVPCGFDEARCAIRQRIDRLQRASGSARVKKGQWRARTV